MDPPLCKPLRQNTMQNVEDVSEEFGSNESELAFLLFPPSSRACDVNIENHNAAVLYHCLYSICIPW